MDDFLGRFDVAHVLPRLITRHRLIVCLPAVSDSGKVTADCWNFNSIVSGWLFKQCVGRRKKESRSEFVLKYLEYVQITN